MKYLHFLIVDGPGTVSTDVKWDVVPLLEDMTPEQVVERLLATPIKRVQGQPDVPMIGVPDVPRGASDAALQRTAEARKLDHWTDDNPEETARQKEELTAHTLTGDQVLAGGRLTAQEETIR